MADERLYAKLTLDFPDSPKIAPLSDSAFRQYLEALLWSRRLLTDGFVPTRMIGRLFTEDVLEELTTNDPVNPSIKPVEGGLQIHDYAEHQLTNADIEKKRSAGRKGAHVRHGRVIVEGQDSGTSLAPAKEVPWQETESAGHNKSKSKKDNKQGPEQVRSDVLLLCETLQKEIVANGSKEPIVTTTWLNEARLLLDKDGKSQQEALEVLRWCQQDPFWRSNILSMPTFRKQYDRLRLGMERDTSKDRQVEVDLARSREKREKAQREHEAWKAEVEAARERSVPPPQCEHGLALWRCDVCVKLLAEEDQNG